MKQAYLKYIIALLIFGTNGIVASYISMSSYEIVFLRSMIGAITLLAIYKLSRQNFSFFKFRKQFIYLTISGIALGGSWIFLYEAYQQIGVGVASLVYYCGPIIVMALSPLLFKERLTAFKIMGFATVLLGLVFVNGNMSSGSINIWGLTCGGCSAVLYAVMVIFNKKVSDIKGMENSLLQLIASFITVAAFIGFKQGFVIHLSSVDILPVLILGLINTGIGCYLYFSQLSELPVQTVSVCGYLEPLAAVIFSAMILHEAMRPMQIAGTALILSGAIFAECGQVLIQKRIRRYT